MDTLGDRMKGYETSSEVKLIKRLPVIIRVDGRSFSRLCRKLHKPYDPLFLEAMAETMHYVVSEMAGACFAYQQSDEITFILKNDQTNETEPWYGNRVQKISSIAAGLATLGLQKSLVGLNLDLVGDAIFDARVWVVPNLSEALNALIWRQNDCVKNAVAGTSLALLGKKYGRKTAMKLVHGKSAKERLMILQDECNIDFHQEYPASFRLGVACYKAPFVYTGLDKSTSTRKRWILDWEFPLITEKKDFVSNILMTGHDVFRAENFEVIETEKENVKEKGN